MLVTSKFSKRSKPPLHPWKGSRDSAAAAPSQESQNRFFKIVSLWVSFWFQNVTTASSLHCYATSKVQLVRLKFDSNILIYCSWSKWLSVEQSPSKKTSFICISISTLLKSCNRFDTSVCVVQNYHSHNSLIIFSKFCFVALRSKVVALIKCTCCSN